jgi:hypothetical protein
MGGGTEHDCLPLNERGLLKPDGLKSESVLFGPAEANVSSDIVCDRPPMMAVGRSRFHVSLNAIYVGPAWQAHPVALFKGELPRPC